MPRFIYIPAFEISSDEVRFGVSRLAFGTKSFMVVHKDRLQGEFIKDDRVINKSEIINFLLKSVQTFESNFRTKLETISLVIPDFSAKTLKDTESMNFPTPKLITLADEKNLIKTAMKKLSNDHNVVIKAECDALSVNGKIINKASLNKVYGTTIEAQLRVIRARRDVIDDHASIILSCDKKIGKIQTSSMAIKELIVDKNSPVDVIVNWSNNKVVTSFYFKGVLHSVKEWNRGIDTVVEAVAKKFDWLKFDFIKNYAFKMLCLWKQESADEDVVLRKTINGKVVEVKAAELKNIIMSALTWMIHEEDNLIRLVVNNNNYKIKVYHVGKIFKFAKHEEILRKYSYYKDALDFSNMDIFGASENWTQVIVGIMVWNFKQELEKWKSEQNTKVMMENAMGNPVIQNRYQTNRTQMVQPQMVAPGFTNNTNYYPQNQNVQMIQKKFYNK